MFLLDTNVVSELRRPILAHVNVVSWAKANTLDNSFLSAITVMEIELGCLQIERRDSSQGKLLRDWFETAVIEQFKGRILPIDTSVARQTARLHVPNPKPERDALIAATALLQGLTLVTRNIKDFERTGVRLLNPWLAN
jgi:toxin FitB